MSRVELMSRLKNRHRSGFQAQPAITVARRFFDNVTQKRPRHALP
jgi:hypothetical protein